MRSFIKYVLQDLVKDGYSIQNCTYILPSKRSGVFLKHHLGETLNGTIFAPKIISIEEFVGEISGLKKATTLELLLDLFESYNETSISKKDDFVSFLNWAPTLLQDFNEIDRYLLPANEILNYLKAVKELNHWSLQSKKTSLVKNYLEFWGNIEMLYNNFTKRLTETNRAHQGLIYRYAAENIVKYASERVKTPIIFIGFNALNTAESKIVQYLLENSSCEVYWDIDQHFLQDPVHDAGLFIRRYLKEWRYYQNNLPKGVHEEFLAPKRINIIGVPKNISQTKYVGSILENLKTSQDKPMDAALVLCDESLLMPMTRAIPENQEDVNITMGLSLKTTLLASLFTALFQLHKGKTKGGWFYKDVLLFLSNPYTKRLSGPSSLPFQLVKFIRAENIIYLTDKHLAEFLDKYPLDFNIFPQNVSTPQEMNAFFISIILRLKAFFQKEGNALELEYLYAFFTLFNTLEKTLQNANYIENIETLHAFYKQMVTTESLDFLGSPINGLQMMGMLESRTLDFETVVMTSLNEGILPSGKSNSSFIPFDVKRDYGLPTYKEKDAIYTYHFYRLIQRAKNIYLTYNTEPDVLEGGERSRLVSQLLTDNRLNHMVSHTIASPDVKLMPQYPEEIKKTPLLISELHKLALTGFSPTSLSNYIRNPLEFYQKNVLRLEEVNSVQDGIAANTFGTILHDTLFTLYQPFLGHLLTLESIKSMSKNLNHILSQIFDRHLPNKNITKGRYLLIFHVIKKYVENFIQMESKLVQGHQIKLLYLEERFETILNFEELSYPIKLKGFIDRIDEYDGTLRIIDYKTGLTEPSHVKIREWEELISKESKTKAFQLLCYAFLLSKKQRFPKAIAGIYAIKNLKHGLITFSINKENTVNADMITNFEGQLRKLLLEIYDQKIPFTESE